MNTISARRRLIAVFVLPFVLLLAGCGRLHADYEIQDVDTMNVSVDFGIESELIEGEYASAEEMCSDSQQEGEATFGQAEVTPYEEDGYWGCRASGVLERAQFAEGMELTEEDGQFHLTMDLGTDGESLSQEDLEFAYGDQINEFDFRATFAFPGKVLESRGGTIDGNTVTYTDVSEFSEGVDITAEAGGFPWWIVIVIALVLGFLLLLVLAAVAFFVIRSRRKKGGGSGGASVPAAFGGPGSQAPAAAPQGGQGQPWGQASPPPAPPQGGQGQQWGQPNQGYGYPGSDPQNPQGDNRPPQPPQAPSW
ncbi:LppM family (lipo)protein [Brachybacterium sp. GCM10030267]|uniref:LppM family (lipo)protein n=1 Tax=unclassified Brachybacterium TaxID=2623841 RepID=UPI00360F3E80